jgi:hypothetical protein
MNIKYEGRAKIDKLEMYPMSLEEQKIFERKLKVKNIYKYIINIGHIFQHTFVTLGIVLALLIGTYGLQDMPFYFGDKEKLSSIVLSYEQAVFTIIIAGFVLLVMIIEGIEYISKKVQA